jgi:hypothetical protein
MFLCITKLVWKEGNVAVIAIGVVRRYGNRIGGTEEREILEV